MLALVNECDNEEGFCAKLKNVLIVIDLASLGLDLFSGRAIKLAAQEALEAMPKAVRETHPHVAFELEVLAGKVDYLREGPDIRKWCTRNKLLHEADEIANRYKLLRDFENAAGGAKNEHILMLDVEGIKLLQKQGTPTGIYLTPEEFRQASGAIVTHYHPRGSSFSLEDILFFLVYRPKVLRAVSSVDGSVFEIRDLGISLSKKNRTRYIQIVEKELELTNPLFRRFKKAMRYSSRAKIEAEQILASEVVKRLGKKVQISFFSPK